MERPEGIVCVESSKSESTGKFERLENWDVGHVTILIVKWFTLYHRSQQLSKKKEAGG